MKNINFRIGLSKKDDIPKLYTFLIMYEKDLSSKAGRFNIDSPSFISFCKSNNIKCKSSLAKKELNKKDRTENYFYFSTIQTRFSKNDKAYNLLRHIRNSIAHALISKEKGFYILLDKNSNSNTSMIAKIRVDFFDSFITELIKTSE